MKGVAKMRQPTEQQIQKHAAFGEAWRQVERAYSDLRHEVGPTICDWDPMSTLRLGRIARRMREALEDLEREAEAVT